MKEYKVLKPFCIYVNQIGARVCYPDNKLKSAEYNYQFLKFWEAEGYLEEMKEKTLVERVDAIADRIYSSYLDADTEHFLSDKYGAMEMYDKIVTELNDGWVADWNDMEEKKYMLKFEINEFEIDEFVIDHDNCTRYSPLLHAKSEEIVQALIDSEKFKPYLLKIFLNE